MSTETINILIGLGQLLIGLIAWLGLDAKVLGSKAASMTPRSKFVGFCLIGGLAFSMWGLFGRHNFETGTLREMALIAPLNSDQARIFNHLKAMQANWDTYKFTEVIGQSFSRETVLLDGRRFSDCTFSDVTFVFEGTAPFQLLGGQLNGVNNVQTDLPLIMEAWNILRNLGALPPLQNRPGIAK